MCQPHRKTSKEFYENLASPLHSLEKTMPIDESACAKSLLACSFEARSRQNCRYVVSVITCVGQQTNGCKCCNSVITRH